MEGDLSQCQLNRNKSPRGMVIFSVDTDLFQATGELQTMDENEWEVRAQQTAKRL